MFGIIISIVSIFLFTFYGENIIGLYLNKNNTSAAEIAATMALAKEYLKYMIWGIVPFVLSQCFTTTLRETGNTFMAMIAGILSMSVNLVMNYVLIFGHFGFPKMGVAGAALATVLARLVEMIFIIAITYKNRESNPFIIGAFKTLRVPAVILKAILIKDRLYWPMNLSGPWHKPSYAKLCVRVSNF
jgi:Na+-driven multidrug efflux pump